MKRQNIILLVYNVYCLGVRLSCVWRRVEERLRRREEKRGEEIEEERRRD
jgi:hypothetical protein